MVSVTCPRCEGEKLFRRYTDSDGVSPWTQSYTAVEGVAGGCDCELTEAEWAELEKRALEHEDGDDLGL